MVESTIADLKAIVLEDLRAEIAVCLKDGGGGPSLVVLGKITYNEIDTHEKLFGKTTLSLSQTVNPRMFKDVITSIDSAFQMRAPGARSALEQRRWSADLHSLYTFALRAKSRPGISRHLSVARLRAICSLVKDPDLQEHGQNMVPPPLADLLPPFGLGR